MNPRLLKIDFTNGKIFEDSNLIDKNQFAIDNAKLAIVGSRNINDKKFVTRLLNAYRFLFNIPKLVISGGARGIDTFAEQWANDNNIETKIFLPDWDKFGKQAGILRNKDIISECNICLAIWDGQSHGTLNDIQLCEELHRDLLVFDMSKYLSNEFSGFQLFEYSKNVEDNKDQDKENTSQNQVEEKPQARQVKPRPFNRWLPQPGIVYI